MTEHLAVLAALGPAAFAAGVLFGWSYPNAIVEWKEEHR